MNYPMKNFCLWFCVFLGSFSSLQAQDWLAAYKQSVEAYNQGDLPKAYTLGKEALNSYQQQGDRQHANYMAVLRQMSVVSFDLNKLEEAARYAEEEVKGWQQAGTVDELSYINALDNLGLIYTTAGNYPEAVAVLQQAWQMAAQRTDMDAVDKALIEGHLAEALYGTGQPDEAAGHFAAAMQVLDRQDNVPADYLSFSYSYGSLLLEQGKNSEAITYLNKVFEFYQPDEADPLVINTHAVLGTALTRSDQLKQGEQHLVQALNLMEAAGLDDEQAALEITRELARNLTMQGRHAEAEELLALIEQKMLNTGDSEEKAMFLSNKATVALKAGNMQEALALYDSALAMLDPQSPAYLSVGLNYLTALRQVGDLLGAQRVATDLLATPQRDVNYYLLLAEYGSLLRQQGDYQQAAGYFDQVLQQDMNAWPAAKRANILNKAASFYQITGSYDRAMELYNKALSALNTQQDNSLYQSVMFNYITLLQSRGELDSARAMLDRLKSTARDNPELLLGILRNLGSLSQTRGAYQAAEDYYREALTLAAASKGDNSLEYADLLLRMANLYRELGEYRQAEPMFRQAGTIVQSLRGRQSPAYAGVANNLGILYQEMGNFEAAARQFEQATDIYGKTLGTTSPDYLLAMENLATLYELEDKNDEALAILQQTLAANKAIYGENNANYAVSLHNYASLLQKLGRNQEAIDYFRQALRIQAQTAGTRQASYANTLQNLAVLLQEEGDYEQADSLLDVVLAIRKEIFSEQHPSYVAALLSKAVLKQVAGAYDEAWRLYNKVMDGYLQQIKVYFPSLSEKEKTAFYAKITPAVNRYKEFCLEYYMRHPDRPDILGRLYNAHLATKALLLNAVHKTRDRILQSGDDELISAFNNWLAQKQQLAKYYTYSKEQLAAAGIDLAAAEENVNLLEKELSARSDLFANGYDRDNPDWQQISARLQPDEAAVEIIRIDRNGIADSVTYLALVLLPGSEAPQPAVMPLGKSLEDKYFNYYKNTIKYGIKDQRSYQLFWQPVDRLLGGVQAVYVSVDGVYNKMNLNTLYLPGDKRYLIEKYFVKYLTNTRDLLEEAAGASLGDNPGVLCLGDPDYALGQTPVGATTEAVALQRASLYPGPIASLPGTRQEVVFIDSLMRAHGWQTVLYTGANARETVLQQDNLPAVIHLATHGFFLADIPTRKLEEVAGQNQLSANPLFRSGLLFAGAATPADDMAKDGVLTAYEAMNLYLDNTDLVVLSACETALGNIRNGEGVYGLQRALLVAGAGRLIMSLWKVDDQATMELMRLFYTGLASGQSVDKALRSAQLAMLQKNMKPYYWGAFILIGK